MPHINHQVPGWVQGCPEFFVTICCEPRGTNQLCVEPTAETVFQAVRHYQEAGKWWPEIVLLMPDHVHAIVSVPLHHGLSKVIGDWKRFLNRQAGIVWQRNFFEHRLRSPESSQEKWHYILENPVRAGLVDDASDWPYVYGPR
ncbi:MAG: transposase [Armatimonadetes bacterium]|nr:transposase [Armatimonadota bacterium]